MARATRCLVTYENPTPAEALAAALPAPWRQKLASALADPSFAMLARFVDAERAGGPVYPAASDVFAAFAATPPAAVRAVILGQDPYHGPGQAHGLAFSVAPGVRPPPSLANIFKELESDVGVARPRTGSLMPWARHGVLLLNTSLTVRDGGANSHQGQGWERFTDAVLRVLGTSDAPIVFLLWGGPAQKKRGLIDEARHTVLASAHPSPLSAHRGFLGSRPFSRTNEALVAHGQAPIDWRLDDTEPVRTDAVLAV